MKNSLLKIDLVLFSLKHFQIIYIREPIARIAPAVTLPRTVMHIPNAISIYVIYVFLFSECRNIPNAKIAHPNNVKVSLFTPEILYVNIGILDIIDTYNKWNAGTSLLILEYPMYNIIKIANNPIFIEKERNLEKFITNPLSLLSIPLASLIIW